MDLSQPVFVISVCLPSCSGCTDDFKEALDQLEMLLPPVADIIVMGDSNADLGPIGGPNSNTQPSEQEKILHRYLPRLNFVSTHLHLCP